MKIEARNATAYINHVRLLSYLSGHAEPEDVRTSSYSTEGEEIHQKLLKLENQANLIMTAECNGDQRPNDVKRLQRIQEAVNDLLPRLNEYKDKNGAPLFFLNGDPRGYTLKAKPEIVEILRALDMNVWIHTDWGGYFILAPEF